MKQYTPSEIIEEIKIRDEGQQEFPLTNNGVTEFVCTLDFKDETLYVLEKSSGKSVFLLGGRDYTWDNLHVGFASRPEKIKDAISFLAKLYKYTGYMPVIPETIKIEYVQSIENVQKLEPVESKNEMILSGKIEAYEKLLFNNGGRSITLN